MGLFETAYALLKPSNAVYLAALVGFLLLFWRRRAGMLLLGLALALWGAIAYLPLGRLMTAPLEARFERRPPEAIDGIVLLGGFLERTDDEPLWVELGWSGERLLATAILATRFPDVPILITGVSEAQAAAAVLVDLGVDPSRIIIEDRARSTWDNARYSHALMQPESGERHALVTSASHMPRSIGVFRTAGWPEMVPVPTGRAAPELTSDDVPLDAGTGFAEFDWAVREWLSLISYRIMGRTAELLPGPAAPAPAVSDAARQEPE